MMPNAAPTASSAAAPIATPVISPTVFPAVAALFTLAVLGAACDSPAPARATLSVTEVLADADTAGFDRADRPRDFTFPRDHGPHPGFRHEWWYYTGNLQGDDGGRYGFQLTFFRSALRPGPTAVSSGWATNQAFMAHFAVSDLGRQRFYAFERFDRGAMGLAGARAEPFQVHVGDWMAWEASRAGPGREFPSMEIRAAEGDVAIALVLDPLKPAVLQGEDGLSLKGPEPGNASYYYSLTRLAARGTIRIDDRETTVEGLAWLDREWGTSALGADLEGWDWFSIQLDDHTEIMYYRLRRHDGGTDPLSRGSFVHADGRVSPLDAGDVVLEPTGRWRSPLGGVYPSGWRLRVPRLDLELSIEPPMANQEVDLSFRYWEGAVDVTGTRNGAPLSGHGYVELTGYAVP
jgi:predicted secreted hydrolase